MRAWILGEFETPEALVGAAQTLRERGHDDLDAHTPYPVHGLAEALQLPKSLMPKLVLFGGVTGATLGYLLCYYCAAVAWPLNIGGRPPQSAPAFIPITFEVGVLIASFFAFFGVLAVMRLPRLYHPVFDAEAFRSATNDRFWLSFSTDAAPAERERFVRELTDLGAAHVEIVEERK